MRARVHHFKEESEVARPYEKWADAEILPPLPPRHVQPSHAEGLALEQASSALPFSSQMQGPTGVPAQKSRIVLPEPAPDALPVGVASSPERLLAHETKSKVIENGLPRLRYH